MHGAIPRFVYILAGIILGFLGVHSFIAGYTKKGIIHLVLGVLMSPISFVWAIIDVCTVTKDARGVAFS
jgi:TM2 domain-containing membrane protein YozV